MHTVKLTVLIDDPGDIDMEVRVVAPEAARTAVVPAPAPSPVAALKPRAIVPLHSAPDDDYALGGYAGI